MKNARSEGQRDPNEDKRIKNYRWDSDEHVIHNMEVEPEIVSRCLRTAAVCLRHMAGEVPEVQAYLAQCGDEILDDLAAQIGVSAEALRESYLTPDFLFGRVTLKLHL